VLQLTSGQFSPRVLRAFQRDRAIQLALGVFVSTFVYAMVVQRAVTGSVGHHPFVPRIAVTGAFILVLASVGLFIFYIHHVANMIRVATIVTKVGIESRQLLERRYPANQAAPGPPPDVGPAGRTVAAPRPGVLVSVNENKLVELAQQASCIVVLAARVGDFLPEGAPLLHIHPDSAGTGPAPRQRACSRTWPRTLSAPWNRIWRSDSASWLTLPSGPCHRARMIPLPPARQSTCSMICCAAWPGDICPMAVCAVPTDRCA
jgi:uncharacterized membrane protein